MLAIGVNLSSTPHPQPLSQASPHPQPLSQAWERGARGEQENPVPLLPCKKSEASSVLPPAKKAKYPLSSPLPKKRSILCPPPCQKSEVSSVLPPLVGGNEGGRGERGGWEKPRRAGLFKLSVSAISYL
ncbi:hypothetical protein MC7420_8254 [Coleofasciculus chthonoplastes PCC 7420]|uniref:Uncharacterized protein n=1 Tax=Coleofasciculus chthonoplastes PCC 7420 TaxID=118168 RepID=B4W0Q8_9CYAN|nr:hypothetical protein MC7420_8254 [Coleofasciculus chthonoplastes PCC 7420]